MNILEMLVLTAMLEKTVNFDEDDLKEAVKIANEENNTDVKCELAKLKKERDEKKKQLDELAGEIAAMNVMINSLEKLDKKINN